MPRGLWTFMDWGVEQCCSCEPGKVSTNNWRFLWNFKPLKWFASWASMADARRGTSPYNKCNDDGAERNLWWPPHNKEGQFCMGSSLRRHESPRVLSFFGTKWNYVWGRTNRKCVFEILIWFDLPRLKIDFSACIWGYKLGNVSVFFRLIWKTFISGRFLY